MKKMAELSFGSLVKFLQEMNVGENPLQNNNHSKPVLLQIRSIIPVLREGEFWPNQGFFLRVSDLSHALYVSLPQEQDEMVLCDKLHIGQFLFVEKLEAAYPVPLIKGIRPLPGRHPCLGTPKDLIPMHNLEKFLGVSILDSINDEIKNPIEKPQSLSISKTNSNKEIGKMGSMSSVLIEQSTNYMIKEKQREKSLYFSASNSGISSNDASSDEGTIRKEGLSLIKEENNYMIKDKQICEKSQSLSVSNDSSNEVNGKTETSEESIDNKIKKNKLSEKSRLSNVSGGNSNERLGRRASIYRPRKSDIESTLSYRAKRSIDNAENKYKSPRKHRPRNAKDSEMESTISAASTSPMFKRRSWSGKEAARILGDISDTLVVVKHEAKSDGNSSVHISPAHSSRNDSSDDTLSSVTKRTVTSITTKLSKIPSKSSIPVLGKTIDDSTNERVNFSSTNESILMSADINISWDFLPSSLVKLGQEVLRQREIALFAAVEALLEASAAERLLKCLSIYSDIISAKKGDHQYPSVDKFFSLQDDISQTNLIFQSLTNTIPSSTTNTNNPSSPIKEDIKLVLDRKQNATTWIKAALECDLNPISDHIKTNTPKISIKTNYSNTRKSTLLVRKRRSKSELLAEIVPIMENQQNWVKGSGLPISEELVNSLNCECRKWFLSYVEDYLEWVSIKTSNTQSLDCQQVAEMMYQIKKVSDWLDIGFKDKSTLEDSELEACVRVRNKIYGILLKHVERTALSSIFES